MLCEEVKHSNFYYKDIYLGTLYENGQFEYTINSSQADHMNVVMVIKNLERIRKVGLEKDFNYQNYIDSYNNFPFKDGFEFK